MKLKFGNVFVVLMFHRMKKVFGIIFVAGCLSLLLGADKYVEPLQEPIIIGAMKDVMWSGKLNGQIDLDSVHTKNHLFGLGPLENLKGEIVVVDGEAYSSTINKSGKPVVKTGFKLKAPFFCYQIITKWYEKKLPDSIKTIQNIESYLTQINQPSNRTFLFKIEATTDSAQLHIVNLPDGSKVSNPDDVHKEQFEIKLKNRDLILVGFYSNHHQTIFTHHDTFLHVHAISKEKDLVGHLEQISLKTGSKIYLPF